ncbi:MAG TPA: dihydrofolate reductase [Polyangiaceae bacterium]|nr:dihydrofolate reductase [Polyangiaceae bacterium]
MSSEGRRGIMAAVSPEGVIGLHGKIPWHYRGDMRRVKRLTLGTTLVMGRITWESLGKKPLPGRRNLVVSSLPIAGAESFRDITSALAASSGPIWFFGGVGIYREAMAYADFIDMVYVPEHVDHPDAVHFPPIDRTLWEEGPLVEHEDEPSLARRVYTRKP